MVSTARKTSVAPDTVDDLLVAVASGDRGAFRRLYAAASPFLFPICLKILRNRDAAGDAFQDAFFRIWQKAYLFDPAKGSAMAWMATLTRRAVFDRIEKSGSRDVPIDDLSEDVLHAGLEHLSDAAQPASALSRCLGLLDEKYARPILMAYFYGLTHEELSDKMKAPLGTVKSWINRGLSQLKECMG